MRLILAFTVLLLGLNNAHCQIAEFTANIQMDQSLGKPMPTDWDGINEMKITVSENYLKMQWVGSGKIFYETDIKSIKEMGSNEYYKSQWVLEVLDEGRVTYIPVSIDNDDYYQIDVPLMVSNGKIQGYTVFSHL